MANGAIKCPECNTELGEKAGVDPYKHAVNCFHLPAGDVKRLLDLFKGHEDERSKRIVTLLSAIGSTGGD